MGKVKTAANRNENNNKKVRTMKTRTFLAGVGVVAVTVALTGHSWAAPVDVLNQPGTLVQGFDDYWSGAYPATNIAGSTGTNFYTQSQFTGVAVIADQIYDVSNYSYVDNTDNRVASINLRYGSYDSGAITDTSTGSTATATAMTGSISGYAGVVTMKATQDDGDQYGVGSQLQVYGSATGAMRLTNPTALDTSTSAGWEVSPLSAATDLDFETSYAVSGSSFHLDLDFGEATTIGFVNLIGRSGFVPTGGSLIFSDDTTFGDAGDITISNLSYSNLLSFTDLASEGYTGGISKRYVQVNGLGTANGTGLQDIAFYGVVIPEPSSLLLTGAGILLVITRRRRRRN